MNNLSERIKYLLSNNQLTVVDFVELSGISQSTMSRILSKSNLLSKDVRGINKSTAKILADSFQVPLDFLQKGTIKCNNINCKSKREIDTSEFKSEDYSNFYCPDCGKKLYRMFGLAVFSKQESIVSFGKADIIVMGKQQKYLFDALDEKIERLMEIDNSMEIDNVTELLKEKWNVYERIELLRKKFDELD